MKFSEWLLKKTRNKGSKVTSTGLGAGGQAQSGMRLRYSVRPFLPSLGKPKLS